MVASSQATPWLVQRLRPGQLIGAGLALGAVGLGMLSQVGADGGLGMIVAASIVISIGLGPVFGLTTELIVGSAPPERAGAATGISETGSELGGALGIAILGSIGVAIYRAEIADRLPSSVPAEAEAVASDTLGGAMEVATRLPAELGSQVASVASEAFVAGMQLTSAVAAVLAIALAALAWFRLRNHASPSTPAEADGPMPADAHAAPVSEASAGV
jgi:DHA2 family multidrug resistance protein-like MFS transporter